MWLWAFWVGCAEPKFPELVSAREAWERGEVARLRGDYSSAAAAYAEARTFDPTSVPLALSHAQVLAAAGELDQAEALLTRVVQGHPDSGEAWYNRACYRVRLGRHADAVPDLARALELGARSPLQAAADPDLAPVAQMEGFAALIPPVPLLVWVTGPPGAVFIGGMVEIGLRILSLPDDELKGGLHLRVGAGDPGCLTLVRVVEDQAEGPGIRVRDLTLQLRATAPCNASFPSLIVDADGVSASTPPVVVTVEAPAGVAGVPAPLPEELPMPGGLPGGERFRLGSLGGGVSAMGPPSARFSAGPVGGAARRPDVSLELRQQGQPRGAGGWWRGPGPLQVDAEGFSALSKTMVARDLGD